MDELPEGDVLIRVAFSSLNYKDALAASGHQGVVKQFPHVPGVDAAGTVVAEQCKCVRRGRPGHRNGLRRRGHALGRLGRVHPRAARVDRAAARGPDAPRGDDPRHGRVDRRVLCRRLAETRHPAPQRTGRRQRRYGRRGECRRGDPRQAGVRRRRRDRQGRGPRLFETPWGAQILAREEVDDRSGRPLLSGRWAGGVDTVGGNILGTLLRSLRHGGCVAACGLASSNELPVTVYPFILRAVTLAGIDAAWCPVSLRLAAWQRLAGPWKPENLESMAHFTTLAGIGPYITDILAGRIRGRVVVELA